MQMGVTADGRLAQTQCVGYRSHDTGIRRIIQIYSDIFPCTSTYHTTSTSKPYQFFITYPSVQFIFRLPSFHFIPSPPKLLQPQPAS